MPSPTTSAPRVLIVDPSVDTRQVLQELLARTGVAAETVDTVEAACERTRRDAFAAVVVDADPLTPHELRLLAGAAARSGAAIVAVVTNRPESPPAGVAFVRKPYHYRELVHKIWASLGAVGTQARAAG